MLGADGSAVLRMNAHTSNFLRSDFVQADFDERGDRIGIRNQFAMQNFTSDGERQLQEIAFGEILLRIGAQVIATLSRECQCDDPESIHTVFFERPDP